MDFTLDRNIEYKNVVYRIVEVLSSEHLLVIKETDFINGEFPIQAYIIPGT